MRSLRATSLCKSFARRLTIMYGSSYYHLPRNVLSFTTTYVSGTVHHLPRDVLSFQQPTFQQFTKHQRLFSCTRSYLLFVSSENQTCRLLKWLLDLPMKLDRCVLRTWLRPTFRPRTPDTEVFKYPPYCTCPILEVRVGRFWSSTRADKRSKNLTTADEHVAEYGESSETLRLA